MRKPVSTGCVTRSRMPRIAPLPDPEVVDPAALVRAYRAGEIDLVCVLGPTASGKTRYAVELARRMAGPDASGRTLETTKAPDGIRAEILSADSRQVYCGMDIGTGKDLGEYGEIPYHIIDVVPAGTQYNVFQFREDFLKAYADIRARGALPILCGGTGLYIQAVTTGYDFRTHKPLSESGDTHSEAPEGLPKNTFFIGTLVDRETRIGRIDRRLRARLDEGLVEEIRGLLQSGVPAETLIGYGLEYKFVTRYVLGELTEEELFTQLSTAIHQFAKRQMTWFRGMERSGTVIHWVEV